MTSPVEKRPKLLGMHPASASAKLLRDILFDFVQKEGTKCFRCSGDLYRDNFSIEHKESWMSSPNPLESFFDLENISYSHKNCNYAARDASTEAKCGTAYKYKKGCRCAECKAAKASLVKKYYTPEGRREKYLRTGT